VIKGIYYHIKASVALNAIHNRFYWYCSQNDYQSGGNPRSRSIFSWFSMSHMIIEAINRTGDTSDNCSRFFNNRSQKCTLIL